MTKRIKWLIPILILAVVLMLLPGIGCEKVVQPPAEPTYYSLSSGVSPSDSGSVNPSSGTYESSTQLTLTATPASDYVFDHWGGDASGTSPVTSVIMNSDKHVVAHFTTEPPAIQVTLDYFGIKDTHQPSVYVAPNRIQLYVVADDGKTEMVFSYPSSGEGIPMEYFQLEDLGAQTIFHTSSVGDHLTISALAYSCEDKEATLSLGRALQAWKPEMGPLLDFYERLPQHKELIGWYEHTWFATEEWGATQEEYEAKGSRDLRLWFRIWSNEEPAPVSKPRFVPEVRIEDVKLPTNAKPGSYLPITLSLVNSEEFDVPIFWEAVSSITGKFHSGTAWVPKNGKLLEIENKYWWEAGNRTITYTVYYYYNNDELDTWSGTLNITP